MKNIIKKIFLAAIFCMGALSFADGTAAKKIKIWKDVKIKGSSISWVQPYFADEKINSKAAVIARAEVIIILEWDTKVIKLQDGFKAAV